MEILELLESIARERCIDIEDVKNAMESIIKDFAVSKYGYEDNIGVKIDPNFGTLEIFLKQKVAESPNSLTEIGLERAKKRDPSAKIGDLVKEVIPLDLRRPDLVNILKSLKEKLTEIQRAKEYEIFSGRKGTLITGYVRRADLNDALITFPEGEGVMRKSDMMSSDIIRVGSYVKSYIKDVKESKGRQIFLSRTHEGFLEQLLKAEVPEIQDGFVEIKAIVRDPGSLSKVAVYSNRPGINPVSVCIGAYGSRIQTVTKELNGEKISLVLWDPDIKQFIANALSPAYVIRVNPKLGEKRFDVVLSQDQFSKAMGRGGQNVSLAKRLCGANMIKLLTEEQDAERYQQKVNKIVEEFENALGIEQMMAHLLMAEGFVDIESLLEADLSSLSNISGFDEELAAALKERAKEAVEDKKTEIKKRLEGLQKNCSILAVEGLKLSQVEFLIGKEIYEKGDLSLLDSGELREILQEDDSIYISPEKAEIVISNARGIKRREISE